MFGPGLQLQRSLLSRHQEGPGNRHAAGFFELDTDRQEVERVITGAGYYRCGLLQVFHLHAIHVYASTDAILLTNQAQLWYTVQQAIIKLWTDRQR